MGINRDLNPISVRNFNYQGFSGNFFDQALGLAAVFGIQVGNAAATMFRLCMDIATRQMLPEKDEQGLNANIRRNLGLRLPWLFDTKRLPEALRDLSACVKDDGNDGAHEGTLSKVDADDLLDFTIALLERLYTEPERLKLAKSRRDARRAEGNGK